ncbi:hypothetical protein CS8_054240 [Cupriavidus sp. 8B]
MHHAFAAIGLKQTTEQAFAILGRGGTPTVIGMIPPGVKIELKGTDFLAEKLEARRQLFEHAELIRTTRPGAAA